MSVFHNGIGHTMHVARVRQEEDRDRKKKQDSCKHYFVEDEDTGEELCYKCDLLKEKTS